jgi:hypothetical protein
MVVSLALVFAALLSPGDGSAAPASPPERLVGLLSEQAQKQCTRDSPEPRWVNPWFEIGFTRVAPAEGVELAAWKGKLVVVEGRREELPPLPKVEHAGPCAVMQMRSDYVEGPGGMRLHAPSFLGEPTGRPGGFRVTAVRAFEGLAARIDDDELVVTVTNPFDAPLAPLTVAVHYEGCYGKPGSTERRQEVPALAPGQSVTLRFPVIAEQAERPAGRHVHTAYSVELRAPAGPARFDLDVPVRQLAGAAVRCPRE